MKYLLILAGFFVCIFADPVTLPVRDRKNITIAFGSCFAYHGDEPADILYRIVESKPDVWVWLGDVAYVDEKVMPPYFRYYGKEKVREIFNRTKHRIEYQFLREHVPIIGVWDDHDYGVNNGDKNLEEKTEVQPLWLEFMDEPKESPRWTQEGVNISYYIGDSKSIHIILLDVRYFKDPVEQDILGEKQWIWLENEIKGSEAEYIVIGSGTQILPDDRLITEAFYPENRDRLLKIVQKYRKSGVILISGDVHFGEVLKYPCPQRVGYNIYELTSSGLTHYVSSHIPLGAKFIEDCFPDTFNVHRARFLERNFGLMTFSFGSSGEVLFELKDYDGKTRLSFKIDRKELEYDPSSISEAACSLDRSPQTRFFSHFFVKIMEFRWFPILMLICFTYLIIFLLKQCFRVIRSYTRIMFYEKVKHD